MHAVACQVSSALSWSRSLLVASPGSPGVRGIPAAATARREDALVLRRPTLGRSGSPPHETGPARPFVPLATVTRSAPIVEGETVHAVATFATVLATVSKHHVAGIVGIIVGALLVIVGGIRVAMRATRAIAVPIVGLIIVVGSILVYAKVY